MYDVTPNRLMLPHFTVPILHLTANKCSFNRGIVERLFAGQSAWKILGIRGEIPIEMMKQVSVDHLLPLQGVAKTWLNSNIVLVESSSKIHTVL